VNSIRSLQKQTLKDIEIIAVNDCSNDNSLQILNDLAKNDERIKIVNNDKNRGLFYSRAMGILNSSGEYLLNLDPDDEIYGKSSLEYLNKQAKFLNLDIISFNALDKKLNNVLKCFKSGLILK
jgi:glycosyltransferase involved in cell wall biosynthesis